MSTLTYKERLVAAKCAAQYPAGHGRSFFSNMVEDDSAMAFRIFKKDKKNALKFG